MSRMKLVAATVAPALLFALLAAYRGRPAPEPTPLHPNLAFRTPGGSRDLTVDPEGNVYLFDYDEYVIRKFDPSGRLLATFGGTGNEPGRFEHLMAISAHGDSLLALDPGSLTIFDSSSDVRSRRPLADTVTCDFPRLHPDGRWAASCILEATAEQALTYRRRDGIEQRRVASYDLAEFYPGIPAGGPFWVNGTQVRDYLYDFTLDGRLLWVVSDRARVVVTEDGVDQTFFETKASAVPFPADRIAAMRARQGRVKPPLFMNVPDNYQLIQHLRVDDAGNVWIYLLSQERTGLLRLSPTGEEEGFYTVDADFDMLSARLAASRRRLYFMASGRNETAVYIVDVPGE